MTNNINIEFKRPAKLAQDEYVLTTPKSNRYGFWGTVTKVNSKDCSVDVRMDIGRILENVRVASLEWVYKNEDKDFLAGERKLPQVDSYVFCLMPTGEPSSAFVLCSGFTRQQTVHDYYKVEDKGNEYERIENSGWQHITDINNGTKTTKNRKKDETIKLVIDQETEGEETITLNVHEHEIQITKDFIHVTTNEKQVLVDTKKDTFELNGKIDLMVNNSKDKLKIGNEIATIGKLFDELCDALIAHYTNTAMGPLVHKHTSKLWAEDMIRPLKEKARKVLEL